MQSSRGHSGTCTGLGGKQGTPTVAERLGKDAPRLYLYALPLRKINHSTGLSSCFDHKQNPDSSFYGASEESRRFFHEEVKPVVRSFTQRLGDSSGLIKGKRRWTRDFLSSFSWVGVTFFETNFQKLIGLRLVPLSIFLILLNFSFFSFPSLHNIYLDNVQLLLKNQLLLATKKREHTLRRGVLPNDAKRSKSNSIAPSSQLNINNPKKKKKKKTPTSSLP